MPAYQQGTASLPLTNIRPGDKPFPVFLNEQPVTGTASLAVGLHDAAGVGGTSGEKFVRVSVKFAAAPGAFTLQIETSDDDFGLGDDGYVAENFGGATPGQITTVNDDNVASVELEPIVARFIRILVVLQNANAVNMTVTISRG